MTPDEYWAKCNEAEDVPQVLSIMRMVSLTTKAPGEPELIKYYRDMKRNDAETFYNKLEKKEGEYLNYLAKKALAAKGKESEAAVGPDEGTDKCVALCEQLLRDLTDAKQS